MQADSQERKAGDTAAYVVKVLKNTTSFVKLLPFINTFIVLICCLAFFVIDDDTKEILDMTFYVSPAYCASLLVLSKLLHFCIWHKIQCCLPMLPLVLVVIDSFHELGENVAILDYSCMSLIIILSIINAIKLFLWKQIQ
jgi:hypothetical protein